MVSFPGLLWITVAATFLLILIFLVLWLVPKWQVSSLRKDYDKKILSRLENENRKTLAQILAGLAIIAGLFATWNTMEVSRRTLELTQEGQITERFTRAINQLGDKEKLEVRLGGIYALERIAWDSERDHWPIMEVLTAYVRERSPWPPKTPEAPKDVPKQRKSRGAKQAETEAAAELKPQVDIQAVLTVIGRRKPAHRGKEPLSLELVNTDLQGAKLGDAYLKKAFLWKANLQEADLGKANLQEAINLTIEQLSEAKTLYLAQIDPELLKQIKKDYPHLLEETSREN